MSDEVAIDHPDRNKIFSCLGGLVDPVIDLSRRTPLRNGDIIVMLATDGLWGVMLDARRKWRRWLTSTPILKTAPQMMKRRRRNAAASGRGQPVRDRRALGP